MAERRMFAKTIIDSDAFLDMPLSTQALYFHLSMRADDEGFINNPRKIQRMVGGSEDDLKLLTAKRFVILFESGVIVIKHWKIHNYIQKDRFKATLYSEEKSMIGTKGNKAYTVKKMVGNGIEKRCIQDVSKVESSSRQEVNEEDLYIETSNFDEDLVSKGQTEAEPLDDNVSEQCIQNGYKLETQVRLGKVRLGKDSKDILSGSDEPDGVPYQKVVNYLNEKIGSKYKSSTPKTKSLIKARTNEGFNVDDFKQVIDVKSNEWLRDSKMKKFLRPETLFGNKFEGYLQEAQVKTVRHVNQDEYDERAELF